MAVPLVASPAPVGRIPGRNLLTGASTTFSGSTGGWTAYGSHNTITAESGTSKGYLNGVTGNNLKIASTQGDGGTAQVPNSGVQIVVAPPGGFKAGQVYQFGMDIAYEFDPGLDGSYLYCAFVPSTGTTVVGLIVLEQAGDFGASPYIWLRGQYAFKVLADFATLTIKIGRTDSSVTAQALHIAGDLYGPILTLVDAPTPFRPSVLLGNLALQHGLLVAGTTNIYHSDRDANGHFGTNVEPGGPHIGWQPSSMMLAGPVWDPGGIDDYAYFQPYLKGTAFIGGPHTVSGDLSIAVGLNIEVGEDYIGLDMREKDSNTVQFSADSSGGYMMQLRHRGSNKGWAASDDGTVNARIEAFFEYRVTVAGPLTTGTDKGGVSQVIQLPFKARIDEVRCHVGTAPTGAAILVDVNAGGTTIFTTQANRPSIAISGTDATSTGTPSADGGLTIAKNTAITVDIDQVGSTIAGSDLTVLIRGRAIW